MKKVYINNVEYNTIFNINKVDSDKLCAIFVHLRGRKNGKNRYEPKGKLKHYSLLSSETGLSRHTIEKYVPVLIEIGFVTLDSDGGVTIIGFDKSFRDFKTTEKTKKIIPLTMYESHLKTVVSVKYVRIKNSAKNQRTSIDKKDKQTKLIKRHAYQMKNPEQKIMSLKEINAIDRLLYKYDSFDNFKSTYCEDVILSQEGYTTLNKGKNGKYLKKQLLDCGMIDSEIRVEKIIPCISYKNFLAMKKTITQINGKGVYWSPIDKGVYKYLSSSLIELI